MALVLLPSYAATLVRKLTLAKREVEATRNRLASLERAATAEIALLETKQKRAATIVADTQSSIQKIGESVYAQTQAGGTPPGSDGADNGTPPEGGATGDDVDDAEFKEV